MGLWVPPKVSRELTESTKQHTADLDNSRNESGGDIIRQFNRELAAIDPHLELMFVGENAPAFGVTPGRWHVLRRNPGAPATAVVYQNPDGSYREPDSGLVTMLRESDMWNSDLRHDRRRQKESAARAELRRKDRETEDRVEELKDRWNAKTRATVSMNRQSPWTNTASALRPKVKA